jgi:hypothetical protein
MQYPVFKSTAILKDKFCTGKCKYDNNKATGRLPQLSHGFSAVFLQERQVTSDKTICLGFSQFTDRHYFETEITRKITHFGPHQAVKHISVRSEVLTVVLLKIRVFWDVALCPYVSGYRYFKSLEWLQLQNRAVQKILLELLDSESTSHCTFQVGITKTKIPNVLYKCLKLHAHKIWLRF